MTPDEMQRTIEFILEHQAHLTARQEAMQTRQEAMQSQQEAMQSQQEAMQSQQEAMQQVQGGMLRDLDVLREVVVSNSAVIEKLAQTQIVMGEAQRATEERLTSLILIVEKLIGRNGGHA